MFVYLARTEELMDAGLGGSRTPGGNITDHLQEKLAPTGTLEDSFNTKRQ